jgi:hypothetical protein
MCDKSEGLRERGVGCEIVLMGERKSGSVRVSIVCMSMV